ncbi:MAG: class I SAM-dependent methyltransferase [Spirochaetaceae bacterium]|nr:MAG: class I SAM-dependent methyltransferase [Spirochaetaceae bacterium]
MTDVVKQRVSAGVYDFFMNPLEYLRLSRIRRVLLARAAGEVLEIGAGSGVNLRYYRPDTIRSLTVSDRDDRTLLYRDRGRMLQENGSRLPFATAVIDAQTLPFPDNSFDTVVATLVFCSVECAPCGFEEIVRVLRPGGRYLFLEHVRPSRTLAARVFDAINPVWNRISGGCNLNRDTLGAIRDAGFTVTVGDSAERIEHGVFVWGEAHLNGTGRQDQREEPS